MSDRIIPEMDVITGDEPEILWTRVEYAPLEQLNPNPPRSPMLKATLCRLTSHVWGEHVTEITHSGRRIVESCRRCHQTRVVAEIRDLDRASKPIRIARGSAA
jgi:hypothetical protein